MCVMAADLPDQRRFRFDGSVFVLRASTGGTKNGRPGWWV
jgi:hypothetical protein